MATNIFNRIFGRKRLDDAVNSISSIQARILDRQRAERDTLVHQTEGLCVADRARTNGVLARLRLPIQQDPLPSPQPPAGPRHRPDSSVEGRGVIPLPPFNGEVFSNGWTSTTQRHQRTLETLHEELEEVYFSHQSSSTSSSIRSVDTHTPSELRAIPLIVTPSPPPRPKRRVSRLPVMKLRGADKEVAGGYRLQTAKEKVEEIQKMVEKLQQSGHLPRPPAAPRRKPGAKPSTPAPPPRLASLKNKGTGHGMSLKPAPGFPKPQAAPQRNLEVEPFTPAPQPKPVPPRNKGAWYGMCRKAVNAGKKTDFTYIPQTADNNTLEELKPLYNPKQGLSQFFKLVNSGDWEKKIEGLQRVRALAQHHPETLMVKLHEMCLAVIAEVKSLRSSVACAAMVSLVYLYVYLHKNMDTQAERTGLALLQRIAQGNASTYIQEQASKALEALVQNCSPGRFLNILLDTGLNHLCAAVRVITARQVHLLADIMGASAVFAAGRHFTQRFIQAVVKMCLDAAPDVRHHGHTILQQLGIHQEFMRLWNKTINNKDRWLLERILRTVKRRL